MRWRHILAGLTLFGMGLFCTYMFSPLAVQCVKGAAQPIMLMLGLLSGLSALLGRTRWRKSHGAAAILLLGVGGYGIYDEYLATKDFLLGFLPLAAAGLGCLAIGRGLRRLTVEQGE